MMDKVSVTLDGNEVQRLEAILVDGDARAALEFLRTLKQKMDLQARHICKPAF